MSSPLGRPARRAPEQLSTARLLLRRPRAGDAAEIFTRYASVPEVTVYVGWRRHTSLDTTRGFLAFSDQAWAQSPAGPYLIEDRSTRRLLGATGLQFDTPETAMTGYILAPDAWGQGYATEALRAMVDLAPSLRLRRLYALCHAEHRASARVLEKCGFDCEGTLERHTVFPNLSAEPADVLCYGRTFIPPPPRPSPPPSSIPGPASW